VSQGSKVQPPMPARIVPDLVIFGSLSLANRLATFTYMATINMHQAKTELSKLVARVEAGEEVILARRDKPVAKIVPIEPMAAKTRGAGAWKGRFTVPDSFFDPLPEEELRAWEGDYESPS
jgi:prevent-host-death family protein